MVTLLIYDYYSDSGKYLGRREYAPTSRDDYDRVMGIIERNPDKYELVNCEYGFEWRDSK